MQNENVYMNMNMNMMPDDVMAMNMDMAMMGMNPWMPMMSPMMQPMMLPMMQPMAQPMSMFPMMQPTMPMQSCMGAQMPMMHHCMEEMGEMHEHCPHHHEHDEHEHDEHEHHHHEHDEHDDHDDDCEHEHHEHECDCEHHEHHEEHAEQDAHCDDVEGMTNYVHDNMDAKQDEPADTYWDVLNRQYPRMSRECKALLRQIMEISFAMIELNLYLDTHPYDRRALGQYNYYRRVIEPIIRRFEQMCGPLTPNAAMEYPWSWLRQPWPWRIEY